MLFLAVFVWLGICLATATLLNRIVTKVPFFNGAYVFLGMAALAAPFHFFVNWSESRYYGAGAALGFWLWPSWLAYYLGKRFVVAHPFSFPSVLWNKEAAETGTKVAVPAASNDAEGRSTPVPSWMKTEKPWWK